MYAVIETGGKQYRVEVGTQLEVELLDLEPGKTIQLDRILLVADGDTASIGQPVVTDAQVSAEVVSQIRGPKTISFKYRPKARSRVKKGHRQELTVLRISDIVFGGKSAAQTAAKAEQDAKTERQRLEEVAVAQATKDAALAAKLAASKASTTEPAKKPTTPTRKATAKAGAATEVKASAKVDAKTDKKPAVKPAAKKAATKATTADPGKAAATPKKLAPKRATKKDE